MSLSARNRLNTRRTGASPSSDDGVTAASRARRPLLRDGVSYNPTTAAGDAARGARAAVGGLRRCSTINGVFEWFNNGRICVSLVSLSGQRSNSVVTP